MNEDEELFYVGQEQDNLWYLYTKEGDRRPELGRWGTRQEAIKAALNPTQDRGEV